MIGPLVLALVQDARGAYKLTTPQLEQVLAATIGTTHGRPSGDPLVCAVEQLRSQVSAVLQARRKVDADDARAAAAAERAQPAPAAGGQRVPLPPAPPSPRPTAGALQQPQMDLL
jgi:hypothetical protein